MDHMNGDRARPDSVKELSVRNNFHTFFCGFLGNRAVSEKVVPGTIHLGTLFFQSKTFHSVGVSGEL